MATRQDPQGTPGESVGRVTPPIFSYLEEESACLVLLGLTGLEVSGPCGPESHVFVPCES